MNNKIFKSTLLSCVCGACAPAIDAQTPPAKETENQAKPNVILIMTDQQSYNAISAYKNHYNEVYFDTPNLDRLVRDGISFTQTYCANPVSVPSRFSLFTGLYGGKYSIRENQCKGSQESDVRPALATNGMGAVFAKGGYETIYGGKVHLPYSAKNGDSKFAAPSGYGFQKYLTKNEREELADVTADFIAQRKDDGKPMLLVASFLNPHDICLEGRTNLSDKVMVSKKIEKTLTIRKLRQKAASYDSIYFYKNLAPQLPYNFTVTKDFPMTKKAEKRFFNYPEWYWRKYRWTYAELVTMVDGYIGKILDALDSNPELKKNTIVVFTSDHGEMQSAHHTMAKSLPFEECERVPLIFVGPNIPKDAKDNTLVCNGVDLLPTLCELTSTPKPEHLDGLSIAPLVKGEKVKLDRDVIAIESQFFINAVSSDGLKYTLFDKDHGNEMLFDLKNDPGEKVNVINDSRYKSELNRLQKYVKQHKNGFTN